ncbi:30S ribosome-binding factor RbfA [Candidatus Contubernalis alkaliaceticus]|uniref:30S ribosome-binding factor RbfA n=1 Tax=Candidatus Contubernalis alkaliaceticus TaxID=338645 RepID=UPI001F4C4732|nr:30S ribosome-binding factor RbfA [Candidatus Contubernalis alkalaceticus]UNC91838.1 30S ribosome-binding factor RbfA [Candidatus Contubernalis alkalaceticus]
MSRQKARANRVAEQIKKEVSQILQSEIKDPRITGFLSVTDVEVTRDLGAAKIFVSIYGTESEKQLTLRALDSAQGFIRTEVGKRIQLRHVPEVSFRLDQSIEYGAHISGILKNLKEKENRGEDSD